MTTTYATTWQANGPQTVDHGTEQAARAHEAELRAAGVTHVVVWAREVA
jgi:hypothetical protein